MEELLGGEEVDGTLIFENLLTGKMPPAEKDQPDPEEKQAVLNWLGKSQEDASLKSFRRISRHEFVHSANDLLGVKLDLTSEIPEDRGTHDFDSDRRVQLTKEMLTAYFTAVDDLMEFALPGNGFEPERVWATSKLKDSHQSYNIYTRPYEEGILFSWTRANNGNSYSFFYDNSINKI